MEEGLTGAELGRLIGRVFKPGAADRAATVLVDLPDGELPDNQDWKRRREMAARWVRNIPQGHLTRPAGGVASGKI